MKEPIVELPRERWKGFILPIGYTTAEYYDVAVRPEPEGFTVNLCKKAFEAPLMHSPQEYNYPDKLYEEHWPDARAFGILKDGVLIGAVEVCPEDWSNRMRVTELWVDDAWHKQGLGHALLERAKQEAQAQRRRAVILETQSCNVNAIGFYLHEGFTLIGMDTCCYSNTDLQRREVRLELGLLLQPETHRESSRRAKS